MPSKPCAKHDSLFCMTCDILPADKLIKKKKKHIGYLENIRNNSKK